MILLLIAVVLLRPANYSALRANAQRQTNLAAMAQAINKYVADHGQLPGLSKDVKAISSGKDHYDLCSYLVPQYLKDIPLDPVVSVKTKTDNTPTNEACNKPGVVYASGYGIWMNKSGQVALTAPLADGQPLTLTLPAPKAE